MTSTAHRVRHVVSAQAVAGDRQLADLVRTTLVHVRPAVADSLQISQGADASALDAGTDRPARLRPFSGLTRRLKIIGVPIETLFGA